MCPIKDTKSIACAASTSSKGQKSIDKKAATGVATRSYVAAQHQKQSISPLQDPVCQICMSPVLNEVGTNDL